MKVGGEIRRVAELLANSRNAIALTGAGISTPSGIPDFRGPRGLWKRIPPRLFDISYFKSHPEESWRVFLELYDSMRGVKPNPAHYALAELEKHGIIKVIITQNIDGLHQEAGSRKVIELHGNLKNAICIKCGHRIPLIEAIKQARTGRVPRCPKCNGLLKPDVVFFGERLPLEAINEALKHAVEADLVLVAGSSLWVSPANQIPLIAKEHGAKIIIVNIGETRFDWIADVRIKAPVEEVLPLISKETLKIKRIK